jgi:hypothetical protein
VLNPAAFPQLSEGLAMDEDGLSEEALKDALKQTPKGAFALAGLTTGLLLLCWLAIYLFVFIPRGMVG